MSKKKQIRFIKMYMKDINKKLKIKKKDKEEEYTKEFILKQLKKLKKIEFHKLVYYANYHIKNEYPELQFENIIKKYNIDIKSEYDRKENYFYKEYNKISILLLKFENNKNWEKIIKKHGYNFKYNHSHNSDNKLYGYEYNLLKSDLNLLNLSIDDIEKIYKENKYVNYFYTNEEIHYFIKKFKTNLLF